MKAFYFMASFIFISATTSGQSNVSVVQLSKAPKAKLTGHSNFGKVYALPLDNMPCIVPQTATAALMPVIKTPLVNPGIPNSIPTQDLKTANNATKYLQPDKMTQRSSKNLMLDLVRKK